MPGSDENVIVLESDDDDEALSSDKDDVVFVNMTPVGLRPAKIKSYLTPISIDSDDEDDDIIFVSATAGKRRKSPVPLTTVDDAVSVLQSVTSLEQTLSSLERTVSTASDALTVQSGSDDVLGPADDEALIIQPMPPKLPPAQPSFHDNSNVVDVTDSLVVEVLPPVSAPGDVDTVGTLNAVDDSRLHSDGTGVGTLSAFLAGGVNQAADTCVSLSSAQTALGSWDDSNSEQQGLLAWLRDLAVPSNITQPSNVPMHVTDSRKPDLATVAGPSLPTTSSTALTSFHTIDNLLSSPQPSYSAAMTSSSTSTSSYDVMSPLPSWGPSSIPISSPGIISSLTKSVLSGRPFLNPAPNSFQNLGPDAGAAWTRLDAAALPTDGAAGCGSDSNNNSTNTRTYTSVQSIMSLSSSISTSSTSMTMTSSTSMTMTSSTSASFIQSSGAISLSPPPRISPLPAAPAPTSPLSSSSGAFALVSSSTPATYTSPSKASGGSIPSTGPVNRVPPVGAADSSTSHTSTPTPPGAGSPRSKVSGSSGWIKLPSQKPATPSPYAPHHSPTLKRSASYMQTHPNNIPLKKRRRHRHGQRLSLDSVTDSRGAGDADSSKCSWCKLMVPYNNLSHCMQGHPCCADCLQHRAKALLSKSKRGSLKCPYASCVSYFPMSQLQRTLPPMVVEILEEKLDQEYINYADDLLWHNIGEGHDGADGGAAAEDDEEEDDDEDGLLLAGERGGLGELNKQPSLPPLPVFWEPMGDTPTGYKLVELSSENIEYTEISCLFNDTMRSQASISRIMRIQNPILWQFYNVKKLQLQEAGGELVLEKQLMHGTSNNVVDAICKTNFDWRLCGAHGTMYGQGSYFARDAAYSHVYTDNARNRSLQNPSHILAMLSKNKKVRANICVKRLSGSGSGSIGLGVVNNQTTSTGYLNLQSPPPAHWKQGPQNLVLPPGMTLPPAPGLGPPPVSNIQPHMNMLGPTIGSTSTGNSGLNLSMRTSPLILALHRHAQHLGGLQSNMGPGILPPPAHQRRHLIQGCNSGSNSAGVQHSRHTGSLSQSLSSSLAGKWRNLFIKDTSTSSGSSNSSSTSSASTSGSLPASSSSSLPSSSSSSVGPGLSSTHQKRPIHSMFVAKVLIGRYTNGQNHYRKPPPIDQTDPYGRAYDSCVDHVGDPKIYVIFDSAQCYPEYLIEYTTNNSACYM